MPQLVPIAEGVWCFEGRVPLGLGVVFPARSTVLALEDGTLVIISPLPIDDALAAEIDALGDVGFLVAPNLFHHLYIGDAKARWPNAEMWGVSGFKKKRPDLTFDGVFRPNEEVPASWRGSIDSRTIDGTKLNECAFFHRASKTLVLTDLVFNMHHHETAMSRVMFGMLGVYGKLAQSPLVRWATDERPLAGASCTDILAFPFERLIIAHGDIIEEDAPARLRAALTWMLAGVAALDAPAG